MRTYTLADAGDNLARNKEEARKRWDRYFDIVLGKMNYIDRLVGEVQMVTDSRSKRRRERGRGRLRIRIPRFVGEHSRRSVADYLADRGVRARRYTYDDQFMYLQVRSSQADWAEECLRRLEEGNAPTPWRKR